MKTVYVRTKTKDEARKRAEWLYMILRDCTPVIAVIATENTCDNLMDERELAKYIVDNETISENENIECRR